MNLDDGMSLDEGGYIPQKAIVAAGQIKIERSRDYSAIRALCIHPRIFPLIADDFHPEPSAWQVPENEHIVYLLAVDNEGAFGFGIFYPINMACWSAHMGFLPRSYGPDARHSFKRMLNWIWANTTARKIVGDIARDNLLALRFARSVGFEIYGVNKKSVVRGGVLRDQVCLGISKG